MTPSLESVFLEITIPNQKNIVIGVIYRPPNSSIPDFLEAMQDILSNPVFHRKTCIIMGDFNLNFLNYSNESSVHDFLDLMSSYSFIPFITKPTRHTEHSLTLIDNIFLNCTPPTESGIIISDITDHFPIFLKLPSFFDLIQIKSSNKAQKLAPQNVIKLKHKLAHTDWSSVIKEKDANNSFNKFMDIFNDHYNNSCTLNTKKSSNYKKVPRQPWISKSLLKSINKKNRLFHKYKLNPSNNNKKKYTKYKNILTHILRCEKKAYFSKQFNIHYNDMKGTWKIINNVLNKNKSNVHNATEMKIGEKIENDSNVIAEGFNDFFVNIGPELANKIPSTKKTFNSFLYNPTIESLFLVPTDEQEILNIIQNLKAKSSAGVDISNNLLKNIAPEIIKPLEHIFNLSLINGIVPQNMKIAKLIPIF